jgi:pimeloyl-ACP methyl ester carboxylesterase
VTLGRFRPVIEITRFTAHYRVRNFRETKMKNAAAKLGLGMLSFLLVFFPRGELLADNLRDDFERAVRAIKHIPYNPRPIPTFTSDVTGISEADSRALFLSTFTRVLIPAPANGKTFAAANPANSPDITLVGYLRKHTDPGASGRPGIVLTHGGVGNGSIAQSSQFLIHISNVLFANGYHVLAVDRRDGLLSRCAFLPGSLAPDATRSVPIFVGGSPIEECINLNAAFRNPGFTPNTLVSDRSGLGGDILAAAAYLQSETGTTLIGAIGGSRGGMHVIRAAVIQGSSGTSFPAGLLDAALILSPVGDENTNRFSDSSTTFPCSIARAAQFYSAVAGSGIRNFAADPVGATEDLLAINNGLGAIGSVRIPTFIVYTLTDDQTFAHEMLAYQAKTRRMKLGETLILARLGHFHELFQADPYWIDQTVLTYFKRLLARNNPQIGADPGFPSLGPNSDNPLIVDVRVERDDRDDLVSQQSIVPFMRGTCPELPAP